MFSISCRKRCSYAVSTTMTGKREQPLVETYAATLPDGINAAVARQSVLAADLTYR
jgi:hypothetical protein